jgi:hypothetical protein
MLPTEALHPLAELGLQLGFSSDAVHAALASVAQSKGQGELQRITAHQHQDEFLDLLTAAPSPGRGERARLRRCMACMEVTQRHTCVCVHAEDTARRRLMQQRREGMWQRVTQWEGPITVLQTLTKDSSG